MDRKLVLATHNKDKARELQTLCSDFGLHVLTLDDLSPIGEIIEDGETLEENALKKARAVFGATGIPSLADDSGLEVHYLRGEPGIYTARYSGPGASYQSNCKKLLTEMRGVPPRRRGARFRTVLAFIAEGTEETVEGICKGTITEEPLGKNGFGYDPVFLPVGALRTFAEMDPDEKNRISHRGKALELIRPLLSEFFGREAGR